MLASKLRGRGTALIQDEARDGSSVDAFLDEIAGKKSYIGKIDDALRTVEIVYGAYRQSGVSWV